MDDGMTPKEYGDAAAEFKRGMGMGERGEPCPVSPAVAVSGWERGNVLRRLRDKEVVGVVSHGTRCRSCGQQTYGWRLGCGCNKSEDDCAVAHGFLIVDPDKPEPGEFPIFKTRDEVLAMGLPVVDAITGAEIKTG